MKHGRALLDEACGSDRALREQVEQLLREHETEDSFLDVPVWRRRREAQAAAAGAGTVGPSHAGSSRSAEGPENTGSETDIDSAPSQGREGSERGGISAVFRNALSQLKSASGVLWNRSDVGAEGGAVRPAPDASAHGRGERKRRSSGKPRHWGQLEIQEKLGEGGFGTVYRAWDATLEREVALKLVSTVRTAPSGLGSSKFQEARMLARIRHPNVVIVHGVNSHAGRVGLWMESIRGRTLEDILREQGPMSAREAAVIGLDLCQAVAAVHGAGLVHRDIKAQNVMREQGGRIVLMDFGLGQEQRTDDEEIVAGTPSYMAPELFAGKPSTVESDIYAIGVLLYHLVTSAFPVSSTTVTGLQRAHRRGQVERLRDRRPDLPQDYIAVIERCLAPDPKVRFSTVGDLSQALAETAGTGGFDRAVPGPVIKRRPSRLAVAAACGVLLAAGVVVVPFLPKTARVWIGLATVPEKQYLAVLPFNTIGSDPTSQTLSDGLREVVTSELSRLEGVQKFFFVAPADEIRFREIKSPSEAREQLGATRTVGGSMQLSGSSIRLTLNVVDTATMRQLDSAVLEGRLGDTLGLQDRSVMRLAELLGVDVTARELIESAARVVEPGAHEFYVQGVSYLSRRHKSENIDMAIELFERSLERDSRYAPAHAALGKAYWRKYVDTKESALVGIATEACNRALALDTRLAGAHLTLGIIHFGTGKAAESVSDLETALRLDPRNAEVYRELGRAYEELDRLDEAETTLKRAIEIQPRYWDGFRGLGAFYYRLGRYQDAVAPFRRVVELTPDNAQGYVNLGGLLYRLDDREGAREMYERSIEIEPRYSALANLGALLKHSGEYEKAAAMYQRALGLNDHDYELWGIYGAVLYLRYGALNEDARDAFKQSVKLAEAVIDVNPSDMEAMMRLARGYARLDRPEDALRILHIAEEHGWVDVFDRVSAATTYEVLGNRERALELFELAVGNAWSPSKLSDSPDMLDLREDPRFRKLAGKKEFMNR